MNEPSLSELKALACIATHRSFRKAADELELAPSTLSHMMRGLEDRMGTRLLNRTTRSVSPTQAGERLVAKIRPILQDLERVLAEVDASRDRPSGLLRLTASETVSMLLIQEVIPTFLTQYPEMEVDLVAEPALVDIVAEGYDAGFRLGENVARDMVAVRFGGTSRMIPVASPSYLKGRIAPTTPDDLAGHICIRSRTPNGRPYKWEFSRNGESMALEVPGHIMLNRTELMLEAALQGLGIAFVPERIARAHLDTGVLLPLLRDWCPSYPGLFLYYPGHRQVPAGLRAFIEVLKSLDSTR
ncbi:LysR family transcriptional regulator [Herbaspirillum sp. WKF16]|uniref:LysR family transcriptional regulator n=1 Tax=Herbaspirillum sp. WKF16 TaxID=3028312 RepID=UPI0023A999E3|nr:LysR family transcriptional regulator [Herbaspirillum sp. WKF16]WDZ95773.1 LysR family transcriptional regulator [Herbaspirillum sp. WKF16]